MRSLFPYCPAETDHMCCGLKPVIFNFPGAEYTFPEWDYRWIDFEQFENILIGDYDPESYHNWAVENYSIEKNIHLYKDLIYGVLNENENEEKERRT